MLPDQNLRVEHGLVMLFVERIVVNLVVIYLVCKSLQPSCNRLLRAFALKMGK